jgi:hypothetical protein
MGNIPAYYPALAGKADPAVVSAMNYQRKLIQELQVKIFDLDARFLTKQEAKKLYSAPVLRKALATGGGVPLNVHDLPGVLAQPQNAAVSTGSAPPSLLSPLSQNGTLFIITPARTLDFFDGSSSPGLWRAIAATGVMPFGLRSALPAAGNSGYPYVETDLNVLYLDDGTVYRFRLGVVIGTDAARTALTIGANDNGLIFYATDTNVWWRVSAGAFTQMFLSLTAGVSGVLVVASGGSGAAAFTAHGVLLGAGASPLGVTAVGGTNTVLHGNTGADPTFSAVSLSADVSGTLPTGNGGTGSTSLADGSNVKHKRVTTGSIAATTRADVTLTWTTAFADANYTATASVEDTSASGLGLIAERIRSKVAGSVVVQVFNQSAGPLTGTLDVVALHD